MLEPFHTSRRKRLTQAPKFYFFDTGVTRALAVHLAIPPIPSTAYYGELFEHMVILELRRRAEYGATDYRFTFLRTEDQAEVDLVIERPGKPLALVEIKSGKSLEHGDLTPLRHLQRFAAGHRDDLKGCGIPRLATMAFQPLGMREILRPAHPRGCDYRLCMRRQ